MCDPFKSTTPHWREYYAKVPIGILLCDLTELRLVARNPRVQFNPLVPRLIAMVRRELYRRADGLPMEQIVQIPTGVI
jgi:hypothetical protein